MGTQAGPRMTRADYQALLAVWVNGPAPVGPGNQYLLRRLVQAGYLEYTSKPDRDGYRKIQATAAGDEVARRYSPPSNVRLFP